MPYFKPLQSIVVATLIGAVLLSGCASAKKDDKSETVPGDKEVKVPSLKNAEVKSIWVPEKIEGNRWEAGHYLYVIDKPSTWRVDK